ncbi:uncharacterized protein LOC128266322 [Drosophila gunungcola]|uniref:uncharacterized protein LOC128266322 n=1 Tax=Drosophila gunungcola TaxID=103775 RepID=UPI0022E01FF6|nr:uncharacterized protein LOC128266322 [Drosophila gunungcola]
MSQSLRRGPFYTLPKQMPQFRPQAPKPELLPDDMVSYKIEATRKKLLSLLGRFEKVDSIITESRQRRNPFHTVASMAVAYEDVESQMKDGIQGWSDNDFEKSYDLPSTSF